MLPNKRVTLNGTTYKSIYFMVDKRFFSKLGLVLTLSVFLSCQQSSPNQNGEEKRTEVLSLPDTVERRALQEILRASEVEGAIVLYDSKRNLFVTNSKEKAKEGHLPASTFKIPHSLIALELEVIDFDTTLFRWDGQDRYLDIWERDMKVKEAFQRSCVPCYQEIAPKIGRQRMLQYLAEWQYGNIDFELTELQNFWLQGRSTISPFGQIEFLRKVYSNQLGLKNSTHQLIQEMMKIEHEFISGIHGKTGWSIVDDINNGWFVGYWEEAEQLLFFATNIEPTTPSSLAAFASLRKEVTYQAIQWFHAANGIK